MPVLSDGPPIIIWSEADAISQQNQAAWLPDLLFLLGYEDHVTVAAQSGADVDRLR